LRRHMNIINERFYGEIVVVLVLVAGCFLSGDAAAAVGAEEQSQQLSVPATFVRMVKTPGAADYIKRPTALHWDRFHQELLVADSGHNRIVVFNAAGSFKFEFSLGMAVTAPADIITDPEGYIYVLGSSPEGRVLHRFDFDGLSLGPVPMPPEIDGVPVAPRSVACSDGGLLYIMDNKARRILVMDPIAGLINVFPIGEIDPVEESLFGLGAIAIAGDEVLIPVATGGTVLRYGLDGVFHDRLGHFGAKPGTLNFPVAVEVSPEGIVAVLDQGRFCVVCYDTRDQVIGEFGGKGLSPGWFINPSLLAIPAADRVVIGQIFENKIQVCALPEFVRGRNRVSAQETALPTGAAAKAVKVDSRHTSHSFDSRSSGSNDPQNPVPVSHLEVSE